MDFISSLIRRPRSLKLSGSLEQISPNSSPKADAYDHGDISSDSNVMPIISKAEAKQLAACVEGSPLRASPYDHETCDQVHSGTSSSNTSTTTIEELLMQINDNLNQADMRNSAKELPLNALPNRLSPSLLLNAFGTKSPSANKSQSPPPRLQAQSASGSPGSSPLSSSSSSVAAGSAVLNLSVGKSRKDAELKTPHINIDQESHCTVNNNNKSNKFMGLTEFDESKIPELPSNLNSGVGDEIKVTFEEALIPTLTATTKIDATTAAVKDDDDSKTLQLATYDTDTAVSSDNEVYAECQSFLDIGRLSPVTSTTSRLACTGSNTSVSEADTYRSALNTCSNTALAFGLLDEYENMDATMENVDDIREEFIETMHGAPGFQELPAPSMNSTLSSMPTKSTLAADNEDEPMDVSLIETANELPQTEYMAHGSFQHDAFTVSGVNNAANSHECDLTACTVKQTSILCAIESTLPPNCLTSLVNNSEKFFGAAAAALESEENKSTGEYSTLTHDELHRSGSGVKNTTEPILDTIENVTNPKSHSKEADNLSAGCVEPSSESESIAKSDAAHKRLTFSIAGGAQKNANVDDVVEAAFNTIASSLSPKNRLTFSIDEQSNVNEVENCEVEAAAAQSEAALPDGANAKLKKSYNLIQDNSVDSATDITTSDTAAEHPPADVGNAAQIITSTGVAADGGSPCDNILNSSHSSSQSFSSAQERAERMNSTSHSSCSSFEAPSGANVSSNSLLFPLKSNRHKEQFPRAAEVRKGNNTFIEKSDYSTKDSKTASPKKNPECKMNNSAHSSTENNLNNSSSISSRSMLQNSFSIAKHQGSRSNSLSQSAFNSTFDELQSLPLPAMSSSTSELHTMHIAKHHHNSSSASGPKSQSENALNITRSVSRDTFSLPHPVELQAFNESSEAMDVDCSMRAAPTRENSSLCIESLSAKELTKSNVNDEKDVVVEKGAVFSATEQMATGFTATEIAENQVEFGDEDFQSNLILNPSDFDYLLTKGNSNVEVDRSSLLMKFDPLLGKPIPLNPPQNQQPLSPALEEDEQENLSFAAGDSNKSASAASNQSKKATANDQFDNKQQGISPEQNKSKKNARMSVDVIKDMKIDNENCNKTIEGSNAQADEIQNNFRMDELEKKIRNEVLKTEDIEKKLKDAEQREEALIKRITDKDKTISKMNGVIEAYEKAIAELISEKEQLIQSYEKQLSEVKADRDSNYHHLTSLETTFSDLHVKYEKSKEMTSQLKASEESLLLEKKHNLESLRQQEQRYEKMKNHAMQQLEIANKKLECQTREHSIETTKLKALLKKEEISRASINEQLQQKSRENSELVKICDELINGQGS